jgi:dienelactone hydrolase
MADIVLFHHALGLTDGVRALADRLREGGHDVTTPDLYQGATFATVDEGVAHAESIGFDDVIARGLASVADRPDGFAVAGISLGVLPAQTLALNRPGITAVLLCESGVPVSELGGQWPQGVPLQVHARRDDPWAEVDMLERLAAEVAGAELHLYDGSEHLFTDASLDAYDAAATDLVVERSLRLLDGLG